LHYLVYKITNLINQKIYIGVHKTNNVDDGYMGSGELIKKAIIKHGLENFNKTILFDFDNSEEMFNKEEELVTEEFVKRSDTYNMKSGGFGGFDHLKGKFRVVDINGNVFFVTKNDPRYISGELKSEIDGKVLVKDNNGLNFFISKNDKRYKSGELVSCNKGKTLAKDKDGNSFFVSINDPRFNSGELVGITKDKIPVKDKKGNFFLVEKDDERYLSGELVHSSSGYKHTKEHKEKMSKIMSKKTKGKGNSQYGTMWIYNLDIEESKKIKQEEFHSFQKMGWIKGRKMFKKAS